MPARCSCSYSPENGLSVAFSRSTAYCIGVSSLRHSASLFSTFGIVLASDMKSRLLVSDLDAAHQSRLFDIVLGENLLQVFDLWNVVVGNIGLIGVKRQVVLMIGFGGEKPFQRPDLGHDRLVVDLGGVELRDVGVRDLFLLVICREDRRAILRTAVRSLAIQLRRIVRDGKEDLQDLAVADL